MNYPRAWVSKYLDPIEVLNFHIFMMSSVGKMIVEDTVYITGESGKLTVDDIRY